jgi:hypothetical protein
MAQSRTSRHDELRSYQGDVPQVFEAGIAILMVLPPFGITFFTYRLVI